MDINYFKGVTLFETLIAIGIICITLAIGTPHLQHLAAQHQQTTLTNDLISLIFLSKIEATKRGKEIVICGTYDGKQCHNQKTWSEGWLMFVNFDRDQPPHVDPQDTVLVTRQSSQPLIYVKSNRASYHFRPFRRRATNGTITFCDNREFQAPQAVIISHTGRPRVAKTKPNGSPLDCHRS